LTNFRIYKSPKAEIEAFLNFNDSYTYIKAHNLRYDQGYESFRLSINQDADKSEDYYEHKLNTEMFEIEVRNEVHLDDYPPTNLTFLNYTDTGLVNPVRTQVSYSARSTKITQCITCRDAAEPAGPSR
jgi:hypothetical protein